MLPKIKFKIYLKYTILDTILEVNVTINKSNNTCTLKINVISSTTDRKKCNS